MNKLVINHLEKVLVTSDAAVMCTELEVIHPAAKIIVMAVKQQENAVRLSCWQACDWHVPKRPFDLLTPPILSNNLVW
jgi:hypothetical protein